MDGSTPSNAPCGGAVANVRMLVSKLLREVAQATPTAEGALEAFSRRNGNTTLPPTRRIPVSHDDVFAARLACAVVDSDTLLLGSLIDQLRRVQRERRDLMKQGGAEAELKLLPSLARASVGLDLAVPPFALTTLPYSLLHLAAVAKQSSVVETVLRNLTCLALVGGAIVVDATDANGVTALHLSASLGRTVAVKALLAAGASSLARRKQPVVVDGRSLTARALPLHDATQCAASLGVTSNDILAVHRGDISLRLPEGCKEAAECCLVIAASAKCDASPQPWLPVEANAILGVLVSIRFQGKAPPTSTMPSPVDPTSDLGASSPRGVDGSGDAMDAVTNPSPSTFDSRSRRLYDAASLSFPKLLPRPSNAQMRHATQIEEPDDMTLVRQLGSWVELGAPCSTRVVELLARFRPATRGDDDVCGVMEVSPTFLRRMQQQHQQQQAPVLPSLAGSIKQQVMAASLTTLQRSVSPTSPPEIAVTPAVGRNALRQSQRDAGVVGAALQGTKSFVMAPSSTFAMTDTLTTHGMPSTASTGAAPSSSQQHERVSPMAKRAAFAATSALPAFGQALDRDPTRLTKHIERITAQRDERHAKYLAAKETALSTCDAVAGVVVGALAVHPALRHTTGLTTSIVYLVVVAMGRGELSSDAVCKSVDQLIKDASPREWMDVFRRRGTGSARDIALVPAHATYPLRSSIVTKMQLAAQRRTKLMHAAMLPPRAQTTSPTASSQVARRTPSPEQSKLLQSPLASTAVVAPALPPAHGAKSAWCAKGSLEDEMHRALRATKAKTKRREHEMRQAAARAAGMSWS